MTTDKRKKLKRLVDLQARMKEVHETRYAVHARDAASAEAEVRQIAAQIDESDGLSDLFPELYYDRIARALGRKETSFAHAAEEAAKLAAAKARMKVAERVYSEADRQHNRQESEKTAIEMIVQRLRW